MSSPSIARIIVRNEKILYELVRLRDWAIRNAAWDGVVDLGELIDLALEQSEELAKLQ